MIMAMSQTDKRIARGAMLLSLTLHLSVIFGVNHYARMSIASHEHRHSLMPIQLTLLAAQTITAGTPIAQASANEKPHWIADDSTTPPIPRAARIISTYRTVAILPTKTNFPVDSIQAINEAVKSESPAPSNIASSAVTAAKVTDGALLQYGAQSSASTPLYGAPQSARPDYAYNPPPDYPMLLREQGIGGTVWLRVWVDSDGHPGEIKVAKGSGFRLLDEAASRAVRSWRFFPARRGDLQLASWVEFPVRFTLNG